MTYGFEKKPPFMREREKPKNEHFFLTIPQYVSSENFQIPKNNFVYSPLRFHGFSEQGEYMVWDLLRGMLTNFTVVSMVIDLNILSEITNEYFQKAKTSLAEQDLKKKSETNMKSFRGSSPREVQDQKD
jgi:hypothetical protein